MDTTTEGEGVTLTEFLLARITEDEAMAERRFNEWRDNGGVLDLTLTVGPVRMLAECEAKHQLIRLAYGHGEFVDWERGCCHEADELRAGGRAPDFEGDDFEPLPDDCLGAEVAHKMLNVLALPYADHPDFDESWRG